MGNELLYNIDKNLVILEYSWVPMVLLGLSITLMLLASLIDYKVNPAILGK